MDKEQLVKRMEESQARCRELFDRLQTIREQAEAIDTELKRSQGDFRTLQTLLKEWPEPQPAEPPVGPFPLGQLADQPDTDTLPPPVQVKPRSNNPSKEAK